MSLFSWIHSLVGGARRRDISRLNPATPGAESEPAPAGGPTTERVKVSGGPLKPNQRRRALRDERLLPKIKSPSRQLGLSRKPKVMSEVEAQRLFGGTLRTRNRALRDLAPDPEQLRRLGLPVWRTEDDVAVALGLSLRELWFYAVHRERERQPHYVMFTIPKRSGGQRVILAPKRRLKAIQRQLVGLLIERLPVSDHAHAFRRGRNIRTGAEPHVGKRVVLKLDLKDFFPSVTFARVRGLLIAYGYSYPVAATLAVLMTEAERQPVEMEGNVYHVPVTPRYCVQGAPTSPGLCNALLLRLDHRLAGLAAKWGLAYTRYADDLSFSGGMDRHAAHQVRATIEHIVTAEGFTVNRAKTRLMGQGSRQVVTGVVVNRTLGLSRQDRRRLRAMAHRLRQPNPEGEPPALRAQFLGKLAYLSMLNPDQAARLKLD